MLYGRCCLACFKWRRALGIAIESNGYCLASPSISYCSLHPFVLFRIGLACLDVSNAAALLHFPCPGSGLLARRKTKKGDLACCSAEVPISDRVSKTTCDWKQDMSNVQDISMFNVEACCLLRSTSVHHIRSTSPVACSDQKNTAEVRGIHSIT